MNGLVLGLLCAALLAHAQVSRQPPQQPPTHAQPAATPVPPRPPRPGANCTAPEFRQFDFWLGAWAVAGPDGKEQGQSELTRAAEGCAVREQCTGTGGFNGLSINYYGRDGKWHQHWVGSDGLILHLSGGFDGKAVIM
ncbi:MAG: hypothetical protein LC800_10455 [Acidobacteria bacterium]|nr:hypothetical protein [Acidobacteriota bacterium]